MLLSLMVHTTHAQPGGGGGIIITIFKVDGKVVANNNPDLIIKQYQLSKNLKTMEQELPNETTSRWWSGEINVSPGSFLLMQPYQRTKKIMPKYLTNQRLELIYEKDTMCIDFANVLPRSSNGASDLIDEINFVKGHFIYYCTPQESRVEQWKILTDNQKNQALIKMSNLNRENLRQLNSWGLVDIVNMPLKPALDTINFNDYPILDRNNYPVPLSYFSEQNEGIFIVTDQEPLLINNLPQYNFRYYWINDDGDGRAKVGLPVQRIICKHFKSRLLEWKQKLFVNKKPYTGIFKIVFLSEILSQPLNPQNPFLTNTISTRFKLYYKNGVQTKQEVY